MLKNFGVEKIALDMICANGVRGFGGAYSQVLNQWRHGTLHQGHRRQEQGRLTRLPGGGSPDSTTMPP